MAGIKLETVSYSDATLGRLWCGQFQCFTLELPWLHNRKNISCIPEGMYEYFSRLSPKNGYVIELRAVSERTCIQIHAGNYTREIEGCILVGNAVCWIDYDSTPDVSHSRFTLTNLLKVAPEKGTIEIIRHGIPKSEKYR